MVSTIQIQISLLSCLAYEIITVVWRGSEATSRPGWVTVLLVTMGGSEADSETGEEVPMPRIESATTRVLFRQLTLNPLAGTWITTTSRIHHHLLAIK